MIDSFNRNSAKSCAQHYFRLLAEAAGIEWTSDNAAEIDAMIDQIIDAAKVELAYELQREKSS